MVLDPALDSSRIHCLLVSPVSIGREQETHHVRKTMWRVLEEKLEEESFVLDGVRGGTAMKDDQSATYFL